MLAQRLPPHTPENARADHGDMLRFLALNALAGAAIGLVVAAAILWLDIGGMGSLVARAANPVLPVLLLAVPLAATFASTALGGALVAASALSFVGLGAQPPTPEWGAMIYEGRNTIMYEWWCAVLPGVAVATAALGFVLIGDGLRDLLDPRSRGR